MLRGTMSIIRLLMIGSACIGTAVAGGTAAQAPVGLSGPVQTRTAAVRLGERYIGPGVITVDGGSAKRQLVLPQGEWTVLAGFDHRGGAGAGASMSTLLFGRFDGTRLHNLLVASFNRSGAAERPAASAAHPCDEIPAGAWLRDVQQTPYLTTCIALHRLADGASAALTQLPGVDHRLAAALAQLGATPAGFGVRGEIRLTDGRSNRLVYQRFDTVDTSAAAAEARVQWLRAFVPLAENGFGRHYDLPDLQPGRAGARSEEFKLPD
jgi:hypothetical protein